MILKDSHISFHIYPPSDLDNFGYMYQQMSGHPLMSWEGARPNRTEGHLDSYLKIPRNGQLAAIEASPG